MLGVVIAQLFRLQHTLNPDQTLGFYMAGVPLATACNGAAAVVVLLGAYRFWRQQNALARGKVHAGGWEVMAIGVVVLVVSYNLAQHSLPIVTKLFRSPWQYL